MLVIIVAGAWRHSILLFIGLTLIFAYYFYLLPKMFMSQNKDYKERVSMNFSVDQIEVKFYSKTMNYNWSSFEFSFESREFLLFGSKKEPKVIIPIRLLDENALNMLRNKITPENAS